MMPSGRRAGGRSLILRAERPAGAGPGGFRYASRAGQGRAEVPEPSTDPGRSQSVRFHRPLPGPADVLGERPGKTELGVRDDDQPRPPVRRLRGAELRPGPAERLLDHAERVLQVEAPQERLPAQIDVGAGHADGGGPQPQWQRISAAGKPVDLQTNQCPLDDGEFAIVVDPRGAGREPGIQAVPGRRPGCAVAVGALDGVSGLAKWNSLRASDTARPRDGPGHPPATRAWAVA